MAATGKAFFHFLKVCIGIDQPHSQTTQAERYCLQQYAKGKKRLVEIGIYEGLSTAEIASVVSPDAEFYAVDPFFCGRLGICWAKWIAFIHLRRHGVHSKVRFVEELSFDAATSIPGNFDFIFVDGDHSEEGIKKDYADWSNRLEPGGIFALHDTSVPKHNPSVANLGSCKYFQEVIRYNNNFELIETVDSLNILLRRKDV